MSSLELQIHTLRYKLSQVKDYIKYLEKEIIDRDNKLEIFRAEVSNLKKQLKKVLQDIESRNKDITYLETQLSEIINDVYILKNRIQNLHSQMSTSTTPDTNTSIRELLGQVRANFKYLTDCYRDPGHDILLVDEINNLQTQTELKLTQIENKHTNEVARLREDIIEENENQLFT